jgi:lipoyl(octanoyl) transferase
MSLTIIEDLKTRDYKETWDYQLELFNAKIKAKQNGESTGPQKLLLVEHPHVYTLGKSADKGNLLVNEDFLKLISATSYFIERGGDITYHGPGQIVAYPIFDLEFLGLGVKSYVENLEKAIIETLTYFGITGYLVSGKIGVWVNHEGKEKKIAAIGIKCSRYISMHGLALNVNTDLSMFNHIVPCGIPDKDVCSIQSILGREIDMEDVKNTLIKKFIDIFELKLT